MVPRVVFTRGAAVHSAGAHVWRPGAEQPTNGRLYLVRAFTAR
jgi:hypothetical protein